MRHESHFARHEGGEKLFFFFLISLETGGWIKILLNPVNFVEKG